MLALVIVVISCVLKFSDARAGYLKYEGDVSPVVKSPLPHTYLKASDLPAAWDWRNINGTNYCGKVLSQTNPNVCGSCWAEASTGALSDRYTIATNGKLRVTLAPQVTFFYGCLLLIYSVSFLFRF
jgi:hypothetical protein